MVGSYNGRYVQPNATVFFNGKNMRPPNIMPADLKMEWLIEEGLIVQLLD
jgi:hypothetical protein